MTYFSFLNVNKPLHFTSHDVVGRIRRLLRDRGLNHVKVGHAGTLDPLATGVLVVCLGAATRLSEYVMGHEKTYRAAFTLGIETATYDAEGEVIAEVNASAITRDDVERALLTFIGDIRQVPPMYSAIKQGGRKLYDLARAGQTVEREGRAVHIAHIRVESWDDSNPATPVLTCEIRCSAGTYIRSIAHDLGEALTVGAHLSGLERTASGAFRIENAFTLDQLESAQDLAPFLTSPLDGLFDYSRLALSSAEWDEIRHGRSISCEAPDTDLTCAVYDDQLCAILRAESGQWHPHKVFLPADFE